MIDAVATESSHSDPSSRSAPLERAIHTVAVQLHRECAQWSWTSHGPAAHRAAAHDIVRALGFDDGAPPGAS